MQERVTLLKRRENEFDRPLHFRIELRNDRVIENSELNNDNLCIVEWKRQEYLLKIAKYLINEMNQESFLSILDIVIAKYDAQKSVTDV
jgi:hypothetical protein